MKTDDEDLCPPDSTAGDAEERSVSPVESVVDLDVLRGWSEDRDPTLQAPHRLPALAELVQLDDDGDPARRYTIHGPELLLGRFQSQYAPIDLSFSALRDHESYRLGAPHAHLSFENEQWKLQALSPRCETRVDGDVISHLHNPRAIDDETIVELGVTRFVFRTDHTGFDAWRKARRNLLDPIDQPALFLKRSGGICGPHCLLEPSQSQVVGRSFPEPGQLPDTGSWPEPDPEMWDLSGVYDHERKHIAFRHALITMHRDRWTIRPLSSRQQTYVNRIAISGRAPLEGGDEVGLGSVLFRFHHPQQAADTEQPQHVPAVIDWSEGRPPAEPTGEK